MEKVRELEILKIQLTMKIFYTNSQARKLLLVNVIFNLASLTRFTFTLVYLLNLTSN